MKVEVDEQKLWDMLIMVGERLSDGFDSPCAIDKGWLDYVGGCWGNCAGCWEKYLLRSIGLEREEGGC